LIVLHHLPELEPAMGLLRIVLIPLAFVVFLLAVPTQARNIPMTHHARGSFEVEVQSLSPPPAEGLGRYSINKRMHGDLEATTRGEMYSAGDPRQGVAGYVAIEVVTGELQGRRGGFALMQLATMDAAGQKMTVVIVPGSGTGDLMGISGSCKITVAAGAHSYDLAYQLPGEG
jgi:hypothetical protein